VAGIVAVTLAMPDPKSTVYAVVIGLVLYFLIERPHRIGARDSADISILADSTAEMEAADAHGRHQR